MTDVHEALSRLMSGDLPEEEARRWRRRIVEEPDVAAAWAAMQRLVDDLGDVVDPQPPAYLDARVLAPERVTPSAPSRPAWAWAGWAVAAAAILAVLWPRPVPALQLVDGSQWVDGRARVHAADTWVDVDGVAVVRVEPRGGPVRVPPQEDPMNVTTHIAAAVAGAVVTVAVYQGTAVINAPEDDQGVVVNEGETRSVRTPEATATEPATPDDPIRVQVPVEAGDPQDPDAVIAALQDEIDRLRFERDLATGQLAHARGEPTAWPDQVDEMLEPDVFEQRLVEALTESRMGEVIEIDCTEYPCIAYVELDPALDKEALRQPMQALTDHVTGGQDASVMQLVMQSEDDAGNRSSMMSMAVMPERDEATGRRVKYRADTFMEDWSTDNVDVPEP